jgi:hypothetical protein
MGYFYVDDSVHERGNFILCAAVYSRTELGSEIQSELERAGLTPGTDEFKSGIRMDRNPRMMELRSALMSDIGGNRHIAIIVAPITQRSRLGSVVLNALTQFIDGNEIVDRSGDVFIDQGMFSSATNGAREAATYTALSGYRINVEQDSRVVLGIQLADLAAHTCAVMLLDQLGLVTKTVKAGENSGYDPEMDLELGFALWGQIRYSFFRRQHPDRDPENPLLDTRSGLFIDPTSSTELVDAALARFGNVWMGCIH